MQRTYIQDHALAKARASVEPVIVLEFINFDLKDMYEVSVCLTCSAKWTLRTLFLSAIVGARGPPSRVSRAIAMPGAV
jgi:hypothetical protein